MDNGAFLAAVQWISSFDAVTGTEADAADADGSFLHFRDVHHREADKVAVFSLKNKLVEVVGSADCNEKELLLNKLKLVNRGGKGTKVRV